MILYLDTSALVKLFVKEAFSEVVRTAAGLAATCATSRIAYVEFHATLARREREGLEVAKAQAVRASFEASWKDLLIVEVNRATVVRAASLARLHSLRGYDAVHLASAQGVHEVSADMVFACFDNHLNGAALAQTMKVL
jgi:predicted nucleic acid-binding protein